MTGIRRESERRGAGGYRSAELEMMMSGNNPVLVALPVLCETHTLVLRRLGGKYSDHPISLVDALLARLTRKLGVPVWTFDPG